MSLDLLIKEIENCKGLVSIHPDHIKKSNYVNFSKLSDKKISKIKTALKKYKNDNFSITEYYFGDLVKTIIKENIHTNISYHKKKTLMYVVNDIIIIDEIKNSIDENNFPNIIKYDYENTKKIEIYYLDDFNIVFDDCVIYAQLNNNTTKLKDKIKKILNFFNENEMLVE